MDEPEVSMIGDWILRGLVVGLTPVARFWLVVWTVVVVGGKLVVVGTVVVVEGLFVVVVVVGILVVVVVVEAVLCFVSSLTEVVVEPS